MRRVLDSLYIKRSACRRNLRRMKVRFNRTRIRCGIARSFYEKKELVSFNC